nr:glycine betaine ABC transporter substrate-binding protein [Mycobacterium sp. M26]
MSAAFFRRLAWVLLALTLAACGTAPPAPSLAVGTTADPHTTLLAQLYAAALRSYGTTGYVKTLDDPLAALDSGDVSVVPGFSGRLLQAFDPGSAARSDTQVYRAMIGALPEGVAAGDYATSAEDKPALAVTDATAAKWGSRDLTALVQHCAGLTLGAVAGVRGLPGAVGTCTLPPPREFPDAAALFDALRKGTIAAAWAQSAPARCRHRANSRTPQRCSTRCVRGRSRLPGRAPPMPGYPATSRCSPIENRC